MKPLPPAGTDETAERVFLAGVVFPDEEDHSAEFMEELRSLAETAGGRVVGEILQKRLRPDRTTFLGRGKVLDLAAEARRTGATLIIMDNDLGPAQARNIERVTGLPVIDRSQLIMDIFAIGARTLQARKQVELAQLKYALPRLKQMWTHLSRIRSGIGMRGPGETQLEVDRRMIRRKIGELQRSLKTFADRKKREIDSRERFFKVSLVGYTNSGKSTLLNRLTGSCVKVEDRLFSTLDTRTRKWDLGRNMTVLLSDTVGFIRKLPFHLVASFHATLEEAARADLLLHVVDCSRPAAQRNIRAVNGVLAELGAAAKPQIVVFNKVDRVSDFMEVSSLGRTAYRHVLTSALTGEGVGELTERVRRSLLDTFALLAVTAPVSSGRLRAFIAERAAVIGSTAGDGFETFILRLPPWDLGGLRALADAEGGRVREGAAPAS